MIFARMKRTVVDEIMDSPTLDRGEHVRALAGLGRVNEVSGAVECMVRPIVGMARRAGLREISMLDVACGGGDVPIGVAVAAREAGVSVRLTLTDRSGVALGLAKEAARVREVPVETVESDAVAGLPGGGFDVVTNSLFLHHLDREEAVRVLGHMRKAAGRLVVVNDLRRSRAGWLLAWTACRILTKSAVVRFDGPASARAAWTLEELEAMAREAGMRTAIVARAWPWRMLLRWQAEVSDARATLLQADAGRERAG